MRGKTGEKKRIFRRAAGRAAFAALIGALSFAGWTWADGIVVREVAIEGARYADEETLRALAAVDEGMRMLDVDPRLVADRAVRHPWVRTCAVKRLPSGVVRIVVGERVPVALALAPDGRLAAWLDAEGRVMPLSEGAAWDVPLVWGAALPENRTRPVREASLRALLAALPASDPLPEALVSSFEADRAGNITMHAAIPGGGAVAVQLGNGGYAEKFRRLRAFWTQAARTRPDKTFTAIDLRFDGQVVTKES